MVRQAKGARSHGSISFYLVLLQHSARSRFGTFGNVLPRTAKCTNLHPVPKVRKCSGCCCGCSNGHVRKSESARAVVVGVQTATSESPKVLHFWHFRTFGPEQIRESKSLLFQIQIWHFRHFRTRADSGVQISIVKDWYIVSFCERMRRARANCSTRRVGHVAVAL